MLIAEFERHSGLLRMLLILRREGSLNFQQFIDKYGLYSTSFYRSISKAQQMGLISIKVIKSNGRAVKFAQLTELGMKISDELLKIEAEMQANLKRPDRSA
jgi:DNA-binding PadR family transcriptional regulator